MGIIKKILDFEIFDLAEKSEQKLFESITEKNFIFV
jgi:hypothetical protein